MGLYCSKAVQTGMKENNQEEWFALSKVLQTHTEAAVMCGWSTGSVQGISWCKSPPTIKLTE